MFYGSADCCSLFLTPSLSHPPPYERKFFLSASHLLRSNDKNWRPLAASFGVVDRWAWPAENDHCVNTLAFIGPRRDEGPGSGPSPTCY